MNNNVIGMRHTEDDKYIITVNKVDTDKVFDTVEEAIACMGLMLYGEVQDER